MLDNEALKKNLTFSVRITIPIFILLKLDIQRTVITDGILNAFETSWTIQ